MSLAIVALLVSILTSYYYFKNIEYNSYAKNVLIYFCISFSLNIFNLIFGQSSFLLVFVIVLLESFIDVLIMRFVRAKTESLILFIILSGLLALAIRWVLMFFLLLIF